MWLVQPEFKPFVHDAWKCGDNLTPMDAFRCGLGSLKFLVKSWNRTTFGNIKEKKKTNCWKRLTSYKRKLLGDHNSNNISRELLDKINLES